jgi:hypothetical protein
LALETQKLRTKEKVKKRRGREGRIKGRKGEEVQEDGKRGRIKR